MRWARIAPVLALAVAGGPAAAYVRTTSNRGVPLAWPLPVVPYTVNPNHPYLAPSCATTPAADPAIEVARAAFGAWQQSCASLRLVYAGPIDEIRVAANTGENVVVFRRGWCSQNAQALADPCMTDPDVDCGNIYDCFEDAGAGDHGIVALTSVLYQPGSGRIFGADIEVNGWDGQAGSPTPVAGSGPAHGWYFTCDKQPGWSSCTAYGQDGCYFIDLQNTITHEAGHFIGLRHPCYAGSLSDADLPACSSNSAYAATTMYPQTSIGDVEKRTLSDDDIAGVCAIYPENPGGCGCGSGGAPGLLAGVLGAMALWPRRRRP